MCARLARAHRAAGTARRMLWPMTKAKTGLKSRREPTTAAAADTAAAFGSLRALERELKRKVFGRQSHVPTFFDNFAYRTLRAAIESRSLGGRTDDERRHIAELLR